MDHRTTAQEGDFRNNIPFNYMSLALDGLCEYKRKWTMAV